MLSILLFYFVWKRFADLALEYGKSKHYGWIGIICYLGSLLSFGIIIGMLNEIFDWGIDFENNTALRFVDIPIGVGSCYVLYIILEKKWKSEIIYAESIEDIGVDAEREE